MKLICKFKGCQWGAIEWATNYSPTHHLLSLLCCSLGMATVAVAVPVAVAAVPAICTHFSYLPALWQRDQSDKSHNYCALPSPHPCPHWLLRLAMLAMRFPVAWDRHTGNQLCQPSASLAPWSYVFARTAILVQFVASAKTVAYTGKNNTLNW